MKRKIKAGGITFETGFGKVVVNEYMSNFGVSFNAGDLKGVDVIRWNITKEDDASGAAFETVALTDAYVDMTINMVDYFNARFNETGSYILYLQCLKGSTFVDGTNLQFYFCRYANYQMGITYPNTMRPVFAPAVYKYSQKGLHVDTETAVADTVVFEVGGYSEVRKVHEGVAAFDAQEYLRQLFKDLKPWDQVSKGGVFRYLYSNGMMSADSVVVKLIDKNGKMIGVSEHDIFAFFSVGLFFDRTNVSNQHGRWRKRKVFYNLPGTVDIFQDDTKHDADGHNATLAFIYVKPYDCGDGTYSNGITRNIKADGVGFVSVDVLAAYREIISGAATYKEIDQLIAEGCFLTAEKHYHADGSTGDDLGVAITFDASTCGTYCRWISRWGERCYWLFATGEESLQTKAGSTFERNDDFKESKFTNVETTRTFKVGDVVGNGYLDFLCGFADGWAQQVYDRDKGTWTDVEVLDAKVSVSKQAVGNRIEFEVSIPQTNVKF